MKKQSLFLVAILCFCLFSCKTKQSIKESRTNVDPQEVEKDLPFPIMTFDRVLHDFGPIKKGEKKETTFYFTNTGNADLEIEIVTSCHCTALNYSTDPVPPKGKGAIHLMFDSSQKDESDLIDVTIILRNVNPENGYPIVEEVKYTYELIK